VICLQGHIWREGFQSGELKGELFRDVPDALVRWRAQGIKTYIYSSGSREAQKNLFGHTTVGDMRPYLYGFFDTTSGPKVSGSTPMLPGLVVAVKRFVSTGGVKHGYVWLPCLCDILQLH
jgi:methionine salvage enolase-phosphatase E1